MQTDIENGMLQDELFYEGLAEGDTAKLLKVPMSDIHNHSTKGCRRSWLGQQLNLEFSNPPARFGGLTGMQEWFTSSIKPYCTGREGIILRWKGAFEEAERNNIVRLAMNFGAAEIELVGGIDAFKAIIEGFHRKHCPNTVFEPEITYMSSCNIEEETGRIDQYVSSGYFRSIDVCGGENLKPFEDFLLLYCILNTAFIWN